MYIYIYIYVYIYTYIYIHMYILVGGIPTPLKHMSSSIGIINLFPIFLEKNNPVTFQENHKPVVD